MTILAPVGIDNIAESTTPSIKQKTEIMAEKITTLLNPLNIRIDIIAGNIIKPEIRRVPIRRIPTTITSAVKSAIIIL